MSSSTPIQRFERSVQPAANGPTGGPGDSKAEQRLQALTVTRAARSTAEHRLSILARNPEAARPPVDETPSVPAIAQDAFISRSYTLDNPAVVGHGLDGAVRAAAAVAEDLQGLGHAETDPVARVALTGKLIRDGSRFVTYSHEALVGVGLAHQHLAQRSTTLQRAQAATSEVGARIASAVGQPSVRPLLDGIKRVGAVGSLGLAVLATPGLARSAVTGTLQAGRVLSDPRSTGQQRLTAVRDAAYTDAALIYTLAAVPSSIKTLAQVGTQGGLLGQVSGRAMQTGAYARAERWSKAAMPVADVTLLAADAINLHHVLNDPNANTAKRARAALYVGLDATKLAMHAFPKTRAVQTIYTVAGIAQLGLAVHAMATRGRD